MPFISSPTYYKSMRNNKSAYDNENFVSTTVQNLLKSGYHLNPLLLILYPLILDHLECNV